MPVNEPNALSDSAPTQQEGSFRATADLHSMADAPNFYTDNLNVIVNQYGVRLLFGTIEMDGKVHYNTSVSMSPQFAFVLAQVLRNNLRAYIEKVGPISLPNDVLSQLGISKEL